MKSICKTFAILALLVGTALGQPKFGTSVDFEQSEVITASSASLEPQSDRVDVFLTDPSKDRIPCLQIRISTTAKFVTVRARSVTTGARVAVHRRQNGSHYFLGSPGKYEIEVIEFDPELGIEFSDYDRAITGNEPDQPPPPPPPGGFESLRVVATEKAKSLNDPKTAAALSIAYRTATESMAGKSLDECREIAKAARRAALLARTGNSLLVDWKGFLDACDVELTKVVTTSEQYQEACVVISDSLKNQG